jgi:hypothetical protein
MWNAQLIEYPIISRNKAGEWNYFDVTPENQRWSMREAKSGRPMA